MPEVGNQDTRGTLDSLLCVSWAGKVSLELWVSIRTEPGPGKFSDQVVIFGTGNAKSPTTDYEELREGF